MFLCLFLVPYFSFNSHRSVSLYRQQRVVGYFMLPHLRCTMHENSPKTP